MYSHVTIASDDEKFKALENKLNKNLESQCKDMMKTVEKIMTEKEKEINDLKKDLNVKNAQINAFEVQVSELEKKHHAHKKHQDKRIKDL